MKEPPQHQQHSAERLRKIADDYERTAATVLKGKCAVCQGGSTAYPWYYVIPGVKQLIDLDVEEGHSHLDFTHGFPLKGHGTIEDDLKAIDKVARDGSMPPLRYRIMHWDSALTAVEQEVLQQWVARPFKTLELKNPSQKKWERGSLPRNPTHRGETLKSFIKRFSWFFQLISFVCRVEPRYLAAPTDSSRPTHHFLNSNTQHQESLYPCNFQGAWVQRIPCGTEN